MSNEEFNLITSLLFRIVISLWIIAGVQLGRLIFDFIDRITEGDK